MLAPPPDVATDKVSYKTGETVKVTWTNTPASSPKDWVGIVRVGEPYDTGIVGTPGTFAFTNGASNGTANLTLPPGNGSYQVVYFLAGNTGFSDLKESARSSDFTVTAGPFVDITANGASDLLLIPVNTQLAVAWNSANVVSCKVLVTIGNAAPIVSTVTPNAPGGGPTAITKETRFEIQCLDAAGTLYSDSILLLPSGSSFFDRNPLVANIISAFEPILRGFRFK